MLIVKDTPTYEQTPQGSYPAACIKVVDLGLQPGYKTTMKQNKDQQKILIQWELEGGYIHSERYTASIGPKAKLRAILESWRGRGFTQKELEGFDLMDILGKPAYISIVHKANESGELRARLSSIQPTPKGLEGYQPTEAPVAWSIEDGENEVYKSLPDWIKNVISERIMEDAPAKSEDSLGDDIPF